MQQSTEGPSSDTPSEDLQSVDVSATESGDMSTLTKARTCIVVYRTCRLLTELQSANCTKHNIHESLASTTKSSSGIPLKRTPPGPKIFPLLQGVVSSGVSCHGDHAPLAIVAYYDGARL